MSTCMEKPGFWKKDLQICGSMRLMVYIYTLYRICLVSMESCERVWVLPFSFLFSKLISWHVPIDQWQCRSFGHSPGCLSLRRSRDPGDTGIVGSWPPFMNCRGGRRRVMALMADDSFLQGNESGLESHEWPDDTRDDTSRWVDESQVKNRMW